MPKPPQMVSQGPQGHPQQQLNLCEEPINAEHGANASLLDP